MPEAGCTTSGDTYYLFDKNSLEPIGEPSEVKADLYQNLPAGRARADTQRGRGSAGHRGGRGRAQGRPGDRGRRRIRRAVVSSSSSTTALPSPATRSPIRSRAPTSSTSRPSTFNFTDAGREAFSDVTADDRRSAARTPARRPTAARRARGSRPTTPPASRGHFAIVLDGELVSSPIINFVDNPAGIDGRTGAQISGASRPGGQRPRRGPQDRRAADQARADQPVDGLGDARPAGARPGPEGRARSGSILVLLLPARLLPLPRRRSLRSGWSSTRSIFFALIKADPDHR